MNPKLNTYEVDTETVTAGDTGSASLIAIRLRRQEIGGRRRLASGKNIRVHVVNTGTITNSTNATIAATSGYGTSAVEAHTANKDITFSEVKGVAQVETATVVAASGATANGTLPVTVTSALFTAPAVVNVALTTTEDTAAKVATAIRAALTANTTIASHFTVGGSSAAVALTAKVNRADDSTLNIAWTAAVAGVGAVVTSTNTTAGVAAEPGVFRISLTNATAETVDLIVTDRVTAEGVPFDHVRLPVTHAAP
jgi:hypothetical protein